MPSLRAGRPWLAGCAALGCRQTQRAEEGRCCLADAHVLSRSSVLRLRRCSCRRPTVVSPLGSAPGRPGRPMAESLLDRIHSELRARMRELEPAVGEYEQLQAADAALSGLAPGPPTDGRVRATASSDAPAPRRSRPGRTSRTRAPRGANRAAVLLVLSERPGVSVAELAYASGVGRTGLYGLLRTLEQRGEVAKEQLPGGTTGYRLAPPAPAEPTTAAPDPS